MEKRGIFCCCRTLFVIWVVSLNEIAIQRSRYCFFFFFRFFLFLFRCQLPPPFFFLTVDYSLYPLNFCNYCGFQTVYVDSFHAQYCNHCGAVEEIDAEKFKAQQEQERLQREVTYTIADGSPIYNPDAYSRTNIRHGRTFAMPGSGRTISMKDAVTDKLRFKDGRTKEMDQIFKAQDEQLTATGRTILSDRLELKRSSDITSSDELIAEKGNTQLRSSRDIIIGKRR